MLRLPGSYKLGRREREVHAKVEGGRVGHQQLLAAAIEAAGLSKEGTG